jgi:lysophospholipase L1-like esterase
MTIDWAAANVDTWLKELNPEVALIMFGSNDIRPEKIDAKKYELKLRSVIQKCLDNGTVVILQTIPPQHNRLDNARQIVAVQKQVARDLKAPLSDYFGEILKRRPDDWDGAIDKFKDPTGKASTYDVPTLLSRDGVHPSNPNKYKQDYTAEALSKSGFALRTFLVLNSYHDVMKSVLKAAKTPTNRLTTTPAHKKGG